jgi:hypothetical protein
VADEGEFIPSIVNQLQCEDEEDGQMDDEDDDEDDMDDEPMPQEWLGSDFGHLAIRHGVMVPWDCRENKIVQGAMYGSVDEVKDVVKCWSVSMMQE